MTTTVNTRKSCIKCFEVKPLSEFYPHKQMLDGHLNMCKGCGRREAKRHRDANLEKYRAYDRKRGYRPADPIKTYARNAVNHALLSGRIVKGECEVGVDCRGRIEGHHDDYTSPLKVRWLCKKHHAEHHRNEEQEVA